MDGTALITGASGGIGRALAFRFAEAGNNLVLASRDEERLESLALEIRSKYGIDVKIVAIDLAEEGAAARLHGAVAGMDIKFLVNSAGFGDYGLFTDRSMEKYGSMIRLNMSALTELTHLFTKDMLVAGGGRIMNVASVAAFQAGPYWAVYSASKAYVLSLTEALGREYRGTGVTFTALCPGPTSTEFEKAAESGDSKMFSRLKNSTPEHVAHVGYKNMMKGKAICTPGFTNRAVVVFSKMMPRSVMTGLFARIQ